MNFWCIDLDSILYKGSYNESKKDEFKPSEGPIGDHIDTSTATQVERSSSSIPFKGHVLLSEDPVVAEDHSNSSQHSSILPHPGLNMQMYSAPEPLAPPFPSPNVIAPPFPFRK